MHLFICTGHFTDYLGTKPSLQGRMRATGIEQHWHRVLWLRLKWPHVSFEGWRRPFDNANMSACALFDTPLCLNIIKKMKQTVMLILGQLGVLYSHSEMVFCLDEAKEG